MAEETSATGPVILDGRTAAERNPVAIQGESTPKSSISFDVLLNTSVHKGKEGEIDYSLSLQPEMISSTTTLRFNLDPFHIRGYRNITIDSVRSWISYITGFIDEIRYRSFNEVVSVALSRDVIIPGDAFGISSAITNSFKPVDKNLGFLHTLKVGPYSHTLSVSNLSFTNSDDRELLSFDASVSTGTYPLTFGTGILVDTSSTLKGALDSTAYYPEIYIKAPIYYSDNMTFSLQVTGAMKFLQGEGGKPDGWGLSVAFPLTFERLTLNSGLAFTAGNLQYGTYLNGYITERSNNDTVLFYTRAIYENSYFSSVVDLQIPVDVDTITMIAGEEFASLELSTNLFGLSLGGGLRTRSIFSGFIDAITNESESFISLGYENEAISTNLSLYFGKGLKPEVSLTATLSGLKAISPSLLRESALPYWVNIELFTGYVRTRDAGLNVMPVIAFGGDQTRIGFRFPFYISTTGSALITSETDPWYNFGIGQDNTVSLVYDAVTDIFTVIDSIRIGNESSPVFFIAERGKDRSEGMFSNFRAFASEDPLSLSTGMNIAGRVNAELFADNLENPNILSLVMDVYPMFVGKGPKLTIEASADVRLKNNTEYDVTLPLSIYFGASMFKDHFTFNLMAGTYFNFGTGYFEQHLFSMNTLEAFYGIRSSIDFDFLSVEVEGGMRKGHARSRYFDAFYYQHIAEEWTLEDEYATSDSFVPFARAAVSYTGSHFGISLSYAADDVKALFKGGAGLDRFTLESSYRGNDLVVSTAYMRKDALASIKDFKAYSGIRSYLVNPDTIISLSLEKIYGHMSFSGMIYTSPSSTESTDYLNIVRKGSYDVGFALMTSVRF